MYSGQTTNIYNNNDDDDDDDDEDDDETPSIQAVEQFDYDQYHCQAQSIPVIRVDIYMYIERQSDHKENERQHLEYSRMRTTQQQ